MASDLVLLTPLGELLQVASRVTHSTRRYLQVVSDLEFSIRRVPPSGE